MVPYVAGSAKAESDVFRTEMLLFTCCSCLQFAFFLIYRVEAAVFHWETDATGAGGVTGVKATFSPFLLIQTASLSTLEGYY